jgi:hypothetical protein
LNFLHILLIMTAKRIVLVTHGFRKAAKSAQNHALDYRQA